MGISRLLRDFQGVWEGWKSCFWISTLSILRHFHSFLLRRAPRPLPHVWIVPPPATPQSCRPTAPVPPHAPAALASCGAPSAAAPGSITPRPASTAATFLHPSAAPLRWPEVPPRLAGVQNAPPQHRNTSPAPVVTPLAETRWPRPAGSVRPPAYIAVHHSLLPLGSVPLPDPLHLPIADSQHLGSAPQPQIPFLNPRHYFPSPLLLVTHPCPFQSVNLLIEVTD